MQDQGPFRTLGKGGCDRTVSLLDKAFRKSGSGCVFQMRISVVKVSMILGPSAEPATQLLGLRQHAACRGWHGGFSSGFGNQ